MKKMFFIIIYLITVSSSFAQQEIGFQAGLSKCRFWGDDNFKKYHNTTTGFSLGGVFNKGLTNHISLATGLYYERTGSRMNDVRLSDAIGSNTPKGDRIIELNYLTIPVTANYQFGKKNTFGFGGGLFAGYLVSARYRFRYSANGSGEPKESKNRDYYRDFNYGALAAASYKLKFSKNKALVFSVEDHLGLNNLYDFEYEIRTHSLGFYTSFLLELK